MRPSINLFYRFLRSHRIRPGRLGLPTNCVPAVLMTQCFAMSEIAEILLAQIWNSQWFHQPLQTSSGEIVRVVYPGVWTHGFGPDFSGAMLEIGGRLRTGDVEIDLDISGWREHGHDRNPAFDSVLLHVVARDDQQSPVRTSSGQPVPRVNLIPFLYGPLDEFPETPGLRPLGAIGFDTCAPGPAAQQPELLDEIFRRAGDRRMQERVSAISGELACDPPAQVLYARLLDALGFSRNRSPMAELAARLPYGQLSTEIAERGPADRFWRSAALLLGVAGFLPLAPRDAAMGELEPRQIKRVEDIWSTTGEPWRNLTIAPGFWTMSRSRPASHPVRRLLAMAMLASKSGASLVESLVSLVTGLQPRRAVRSWLVDDNPYLGADHAHEVIVNVVVPFAIAYGESADQPDVVDAAAALWQSLPGGRGNAVTRKTLRQISGDAGFRPRSARAEQGLIHINRHGCSQMRCYECPVAHLALEWEAKLRS